LKPKKRIYSFHTTYIGRLCMGTVQLEQSIRICQWSLWVLPLQKTTGIPCPACGSTRSLIEIVHGHPIAGMQTNPLGYLSLLFLLVMPIWLWLWSFNQEINHPGILSTGRAIHQKKYVASILIMLVLANWIWNIYKHVWILKKNFTTTYQSLNWKRHQTAMWCRLWR